MNTNNNKLQDRPEVDRPDVTTDPVSELTIEQKAFISEFMALDRQPSLLKKGAITVRMFSMKDKTTIVSLVFKELDDSFILGLPAVVGQINNKIEARPISLSAINRMFKSDISMMAVPLPKFLYFYLIMLKDKKEDLPGYFDVDRSTQIDVLIAMLRAMPEIDKVLKSSNKNIPRVDKDSKPAILKKIEEQIDNLSKQVYEEDETLFTSYKSTTKYRH